MGYKKDKVRDIAFVGPCCRIAHIKSATLMSFKDIYKSLCLFIYLLLLFFTGHETFLAMSKRASH